VNTCSTNTLATASASLIRSRSASAHFVYESIHVQICLLSLFGWGPVKSIYRRSYGAPVTTGYNGFCFVSFPRWYSVHSGHIQQNAQYLPSTRTNKTFVLLGLTFFGFQSVYVYIPTVPAWHNLSASSTLLRDSSSCKKFYSPFSDYLCYETQIYYTPLTRSTSSSSFSLTRFRSEGLCW